MNGYKTRKYRKRRERRKRRRTVKGGVSRVAPSGTGQHHTRSNRVAPDGVEPDSLPKRTIRQTLKHLVSLQLPKNAFAKLRLQILNHKRMNNLNLSNIDLEGYNLQDKVFRNCILKGGNLRSANLENTQFILCNLTGAHLSGANLENTKFISCDLTGAHLTGVDNVTNATSFRHSNLTDVIGLTKDIISESHQDMTGMKLIGLDLTGFVFSGKTLEDVNFKDAILKKAVFTNPNRELSNDKSKPKLSANIFKLAHKDMSDIQLDGLDLTGVDFTGKILTNANFTHSVLTNAEFNNAKLTGAKFMSAKFIGTRGTLPKNMFKDADNDMSDIELVNLDLTDVDFTGKKLENARITNTKCHRTIFKDATFNNTNFSYSEFINTIGLHINIFKNCDKLMFQVTFENVNLFNFDFSEKNLQRSVFIKTNLKGVDFNNANLQAVEFEESYGMDTDIFKDANQNMEKTGFQDTDLKGVNFSGKSLKSASFIGTNLEGVNFKDANLQAVEFRKSYGMDTAIFKHANPDMQNTHFLSMDLTGIDFSGKDLSVIRYNISSPFETSNVNNVILEYAIINILLQAELSKFAANMTGIQINVKKLDSINFSGKILKDVDFTGKTLSNVDFTKTNLEGALFSNSTLANTQFVETTGISNATFRNATKLDKVTFGDLTDIDFSNINLSSCYFNSAILTRVTFGNHTSLVFEGATLNQCKFNGMLSVSLFAGATLNECVFNKDLQYLDFSNATLNNCKFHNLSNVNFTRANLREIDLTSLTLIHINMRKANLINAKLESTTLTKVKFVEADLIGANFQKSECNDVDFSYADLTHSDFNKATNSRSIFTGSICVGIKLAKHSPSKSPSKIAKWYPPEFVKGESEEIAQHPFPEIKKYKTEGTKNIYQNAETSDANAYQIHRVFENVLKTKMTLYLNKMKTILNHELNYSTDDIENIYLNLARNINTQYMESTYLAVPLNKQSPLSVIELKDDNIIKQDKVYRGNKFVGYKSTYDDDTIITPHYLNNRHIGYRITNSLNGLIYRMRQIIYKFSITESNIQENRNAIGAMGEFLTGLPQSLDEFKTTYLVEFINSTFYAYGQVSIKCDSCVGGIIERVFEIFINTISVFCLNDNCGDDIAQIALAFGIDLEPKRDTIQDETLNPILTDWFESIEDDKDIGPGSKAIDSINQRRLLSFLKFVKNALRKVKIDYKASLIGYDASVDINRYMMHNKDYICGAQLGGRKKA